MKIDLYTKVVLTVIAGCLAIIVLKDVNVIPQAQAAGSELNSYNKNYGLVPLQENGSILVELAPNSTMDVDIVDISTDDKMDVNIEEVYGFWRGALKVSE